MKEAITYGGLTATPGTKVCGWAQVLDTDYKLPVTVINGAKEGKSVLLTSSIHGCEYPSIEAVFRIAESIDPQEVSGQLIIVNPVNVSAFLKRTPYIVPEDGFNLNRQFPGDPKGTLSRQIAYVLTEEFQRRVDFHIDTHGGDIPERQGPYAYYPSVSDDEECVRQCEEATEYVLHAEYIVKSVSINHAYNYAPLACHVPAIELELGQAGTWSEDEVKLYMENIQNLLKWQGILPGKALKRIRPVAHIVEGKYLEADSDGRWYAMVDYNAQIRKGQKLGIIKDMFGNVLNEYYAEDDGLVLMIAGALSVCKGDPIITYGKRCPGHDCRCFD